MFKVRRKRSVFRRIFKQYEICKMYKVAFSQLYKTSFCFFSRPDKAVNAILVFSRSLDHIILPSQRIPICKKKFDAHKGK